MGSYDPKTGDPKKQHNAAESSILDFLDKEMAASTKPEDDTKAQQDDVDVLVDSLLQQTITATSEEAAPRDTGSEDLKSLFSSIFRSEDETPQAKPKDAAPALDPRLSKTLKEVGVVDRESVGLRAVQKAPSHEVASALSPELPVSAEAVRRASAPPAARETPKEKPKLERTPKPAKIKAPIDQTSVSALSSRVPHRRGLVLVLGAAFVCLLGGVGIVYFTGTKGSPANKAAGSTQTSNQPIPGKAAEQAQSAPSAVAGAGTAEAGTAHRAQHANPPAVSEVSKNAKNSEPSKQTKQAMAESSVPAPPANAAAGGNAQVETTEKAAATTAPAAEKPAATTVVRTTENAAPPTPVETQAPPIQATPHAVSPALSELDHLAATGKSGAQPAPPPRNVTPAVAISRVAPVYPDVARRTHTTGTVVVEVSIDEHGKVTGATAQSGPVMLRDEAVRAAMKWRFKPASIGGTSVPSTSQITLVFTNPQ
jgi:TonB family protein